MPIGKSIRIFLADANFAGIRYAELVNWTGQAIACPRKRLDELNSWPEASKPGVYFLFEARLGDTKPLAYIGESEEVVKRLTTHDREKEFWNEAVIFTNKDSNLTKAHVRFLEANFVSLAQQANRYRLENSQPPPKTTLPRADQDAMTEFTENARMVLGTLGYPILEPFIRESTPDHEQQSSSSTAQPIYKSGSDFIFRINNLVAHGTRTDEGFVVRKDSQISITNTESAAPRIVNLKEQLQAEGKLIQEGNHLILKEDYLFSSSSYAAVFVAGTARSGPQSWFTEDGRSLKVIEDSAINQI